MTNERALSGPDGSPRFFIEKQLGLGAIGPVYLARDALFDSQVVVKVYEGGGHERLESEAAATARLKHPNIVLARDTGRLADNRFFLAREYVSGSSLEEILSQSGPLEETTALTIINTVAAALDYGHRHGVLHRDIKPNNILIPYTQGVPVFERAKVADFGLAAVLQTGQRTTQAGQVFGTPEYMAPEQIYGKAQDHRVDVYGLGVLLYVMLFGHSPFLPAGTSDESAFDVFQRIIKADWQFPTTPSVRESVKEIIRTCMSPDPNDRYHGCGEILSQIRTIQTGRYERSGTEVKHAVRVSRHRSFLFPVLILLVLCAIGGVLLSGPASLVMGLPVLIASSAVMLLFGAILSVAVRGYLVRRKPRYQHDAEKILFGAGSRDLLSKSLAFEIDDFVHNLKQSDHVILARSMALMLEEYELAKDTADRQNALMNTVSILEKLSKRLSPWYVRHEKIVAVTVSVVALIPGLITAAIALVKLATATP